MILTHAAFVRIFMDLKASMTNIILKYWQWTEQSTILTLQILGILQENARTTQADIAKAVGLAPSAVLERMRKLEAKGAIREYVAAIDPHVANRALLAFVAVRTNEYGPEQPAAKALATIPEVLEIHHVAGEDCFLLKVRAKDAEHLGQMLRRQIARGAGRHFDAHDDRARDGEGDLAHSHRSRASEGTTAGGVMSRHERKLAYVAWIVVCVVWGTTYLGIRVALETVPVALLAGLRWAAAGALLAALLPLFGERLPHPRTWGPIAIAGFLMAVIGNGGVVWAEQYVASGLAAVVVAMVPFWTVLIEAVLPKRRTAHARTLIGLAHRLSRHRRAGLARADARRSGRPHVRRRRHRAADRLSRLGARHVVHEAERVSGVPLGASAMQMLLSGVMLIAIGTATGEWSRLSFNVEPLAR